MSSRKWFHVNIEYLKIIYKYPRRYKVIAYLKKFILKLAPWIKYLKTITLINGLLKIFSKNSG